MTSTNPRKDMDISKLHNQDSVYLARFMGETLSRALSEVVLKRPTDPIEYLAQWLYKHAENRQSAKEQEENNKKIEQEKEELKEEAVLTEKRQIEKQQLKEEQARLKKEQEEREKQQIQEQKELEAKAKEKEERLKKMREAEGQYAQPPELDTVKEEKEPDTARSAAQPQVTEDSERNENAENGENEEEPEQEQELIENTETDAP